MEVCVHLPSSHRICNTSERRVCVCVCICVFVCVYEFVCYCYFGGVLSSHSGS